MWTKSTIAYSIVIDIERQSKIIQSSLQLNLVSNGPSNNNIIKQFFRQDFDH